MKTKSYLVKIPKQVQPKEEFNPTPELDKIIEEKSLECGSNKLIGFTTRFVPAKQFQDVDQYEIILVFDITPELQWT